MRDRVLVGIAIVLVAGPAAGEEPLAPASAPGLAPAAEAPPPPAADSAEALGHADTVRGAGPPHLIAFTFDDGPDPRYTPRILEALAAHDVPATFFVVGRHLDGKRGEAGRPLLEQIRDAGHLIGNHTFSHANLAALGDAARWRELDRTAAIVAEVTGRAPSLVRPPFGSTSPRIARALAGRGLTQVLWNIDPADWSIRNAAVLRRTIVAHITARGGGVIVLHDTKRSTADAIDGVLADLDALNCRRLARGEPPIIPVSLHYFLHRGGAPREVPPEVAARTQRYRDALVARCQPPATPAMAEPGGTMSVDNHIDTH